MEQICRYIMDGALTTGCYLQMTQMPQAKQR